MKKKQNLFIHDKEEVTYNRTVNGNKLDRSVEGYEEPCTKCGEYPSFRYDSGNPDKLTAITCEHQTVKVKKPITIYA